MTHYSLYGAEMPALGLGTYQLRGDAARQAVAQSLDIGYRHLDTAQIYDNEAAVGAGLRDAGVDRDAVFLTTKVWHTALGHADVLRTTDESLARLGVDHVDLLLVHWPTPDVELAETLDAFQEVRAAGKARLIGVSNFPAPMLRRALELVPDLVCDQVEHHPFLGQSAILDVVRERTADGAPMVLTAYSPVAQGQVFRDETIRGIADAHGADPAQVALAWLLGQDRVVAIPRSSSAEHRASNLAAAELRLTDEDRARLDALPKDRRIVDPDFAPDWNA